MKKILLFFIMLFSLNITFADSDYVNDYTLIDCIDWDDSSAVSFDSTKPYQSLKAWIEQTIEYINTNVNKAWNEETASWVVFNIRVNCTATDLLSSQINLSFNWKAYNNELLIEWIWDNGLIIQDMYFYIPNNTGQIIFKNAKFLDNSKYWYYFKLQDWTSSFSYTWDNYNYFNFYWLKIQNSYIKLFENTNLSDTNDYKVSQYVSYRAWWYYYDYNYSFSLNSIIKNSIIETNINSNYSYKMPFLTKDSKLNFTNTSTWTYDISFINQLNPWNVNNYSNTIFVSNEIDLWWNNFKTQDSTNIAFINNKFLNFWEFDFSWNAIYFNNSIENETEIDITNSKNLINNLFKNWFISTYDLNNLRKNYSLDEIWTKWIFWYYRINSPLKYFNLRLSSASLYKEITGQDLPENKSWVHVIYNK